MHKKINEKFEYIPLDGFVSWWTTWAIYT